ncbi:MAG: Crp/Fnr family transcriptional regulator, partial [Bacteroidales bacterium]|nr:Crp/Fnr family transcriptional regulator [Bacteroidales bacterium]
YITHIMFIKEGITKVYKETNSPNNLILDITPHSNSIGLTSLFNDNIAQYTVTALQDTFICAIDKKLYEKIILENKHFSKKIINLLNSESRLFFDKMVSLTQKQMNGRVADALISLSERIFNSLNFEMILSRKELAEYTGMSTMSVVRTIQKLKKEGIISDEKGKTKILKMDVLKQISKNG